MDKLEKLKKEFILPISEEEILEREIKKLVDLGIQVVVDKEKKIDYVIIPSGVRRKYVFEKKARELYAKLRHNME